MDQQLSQAIEYLLLATRGGIMRSRILLALHKKPQNLHKLSKTLSIDYKTVTHHIELLEKYMLVAPFNKDSYGAVFFISAQLKSEWHTLDNIWKQFGPD